jgi:toxoflavin synthase
MALESETELYNRFAAQYDAIEALPISSLYQQQVEHALGSDCRGLAVLDLGGGTGLHARKAVDRGARVVDVVDISPAMLEQGRAASKSLGRAYEAIRWWEGDMSRPLRRDPHSLPLLKDGYDIVMVNWTFEHAENMEELETMWANAARFSKSGGKLISIRMANPWAKTDGRYGVTLSNQERIPGGARYLYTNHIDPPFGATGTTMEASWDFEQSKALATKYGYVDFERVPDEQLSIVKQDREFWDMHLADPMIICVVAKKS